ncbi:MAG: sulfatase [Deltaproteobacteria bacterium]|jgi:arylsulfatase A-like enzyme|nr:sulfatase [Deltaproteobacteria bacterium]
MAKLLEGDRMATLLKKFGWKSFFSCLVLGAVGATCLASQAAVKSGVCDGCNVIFIGLDALQAKRLGVRGYRSETADGRVSITPNLDRFAKRSVDFSQAISPASWTVPTYLSVFSSTFPSQHGLTNRFKTFSKEKKELNNFTNRTPEILVAAQIYKALGYRTAGFTGDAGVSAVLGYGKGFDEYFDKERFGGLATSISEYKKWNLNSPAEKFFLFLHGYDSHSQFQSQGPGLFPLNNLDKEYREKLSSKAQEELRERALKGEAIRPSDTDVVAWNRWYDNRVAQADREFGKLIEDLEGRGLLKNSVVVVFADHGTEFFEHDGIDHGHTLYDELVHVPLLIFSPQLKAGRVVKEQVSTIDILPTVLDITGAHPPKELSNLLSSQMKGRSLASAVRGKSIESKTVYMETDLRNFVHLRGIRSASGWKYTMNLNSGTEELYNLNQDPKERTNLSKDNKAKFQLGLLRGELLKHIKENLGGTIAPMSDACLPVYQGQCE